MAAFETFGQDLSINVSRVCTLLIVEKIATEIRRTGCVIHYCINSIQYLQYGSRLDLTATYRIGPVLNEP